MQLGKIQLDGKYKFDETRNCKSVRKNKKRSEESYRTARLYRIREFIDKKQNS